ncbi:MAG: hypothetical protein QG622_1371 [Actinomycetota bacterium]|nr:hypothetical protein [Actinomycetota bacterium]
MSVPPRGVPRADVLLRERTDGERRRPTLVWECGPGWTMISSGVVGGGLGERRWWVNGQVDLEYYEPDPVAHLRRIAGDLGLEGPGVGLLTAADIRRRTTADDEGIHVVATVGLGLPVFAAETSERIVAETRPPGPGTINILVVVPVTLSDAALVNLVVTVTEAKTQALAEAGVPGTGTSSDAVCVACPARGATSGDPHGDPHGEPYGGPRSLWGARAARAVHTAVAAGTADWLVRCPEGDPVRRWRA